MATLKYLPQYFATTLNVGGGINDSQTTGIILQSVSGVDITKPGQICISYSDPLDTGVAEWINYTSINGSNELVGVTRGCEGYSAHSHLPGAVIQFTLSASHLNDLNDVVNGIQGKNIVTTAGGTTTYTLTPSPAITAYATSQEFVIKMNATNTGASTINISGLGAKSLTKGGATALSSGDLLIDAVYKIVYDGTQFQVSGISASTTTAATRAEVATGTSNTVFATPQNLHEFHVPPQGFLYNGKIVPSVASNNLTVALKGLDGNDPSASNPVYVRIGNTVRSITSSIATSALTAGSNWFNAGSAELATKEIDYFVYLLWNTNTSAVAIVISRVPYASVYSDLSNSYVNEKYGYIAGTAPASTDELEVVGRFAATLSAGAGYTWSVPTFTAVNLMQKPVYATRFLDWAPVVVGFSGSPTVAKNAYQIDGRKVFIRVSISGTSNATNFTMTLPISPSTIGYMFGTAQDNGSYKTTTGIFYCATSGTATAYPDPSTTTAWTNTAAKALVDSSGYYAIA